MIKSNNWILLALYLQIMANISIILDIPVARQTIGFLYVTFVPGYILIKLLKIKMKDITETVLFSTGLSVAVLMLIGLAVNETHSILAIQRPFSLPLLLPAINIFTLTCVVAAYLKNRGKRAAGESININLGKPLPFLALLGVLLLSVVGAITSGAYGDNRILLLMIIAIAAVFAIGVFKGTISARLYPFIVLIIAISLVYHSTLVSPNLVHFGSDACGEVFTQRIVEKNAYWNPTNPYPGDQSVGRTYSMISVTVLPTVYSLLLNLDSILVFKIFYSLLFALIPLGLYSLWRRFIGEKYAFASAFFFMAFQPFYSELLGLNKQMLGELFLVLLLMVILDKEKDKGKMLFCSLFFSFGLVVSHYALAEIFLFFILAVLVVFVTTRKTSKSITPTFVLWFFTIMFAWYIFTSSCSVYDAFVTFGQRVYNELGDFFNLQAREPEILRGLGLEPPPTIWNLISRLFAYITEALIIIGFLGIILKRTKIYLNKEYFFFVFTSMLFLGLLVLIPGLSEVMNMTRFYHVLLFFIAPLCVIGAKSIVEFLQKREDVFKISILILIVLVPYFLFQTGTVYELTNSPSWSLPLSMHRTSQAELYRKFGYIDRYCISAVLWFSNEVGLKHSQIYADTFSRVNELRAYGTIYTGYTGILSNTTQLKAGDIVYLNPSNIVGGKIAGQKYAWNTSELRYLSEMSKIYCNGGSEIYKSTP